MAATGALVGRGWEWLHDNGPSDYAFSFKQPFGPDGEPYVIDREKVKQLTGQNLEVQQDLLEQLDGIPV